MRASLFLICTGLLLGSVAAAQPQNRQEIKSLSKKEVYRREFGEPFTFPLQVKIVLEKKGLHPNKVDAFELQVAAEPLGEEEAKNAKDALSRLPQAVTQSQEKWFSRATSSPLQLVRAKPLEKTAGESQAWQDSVKIGDPPAPFYLNPNRQPNFTILSQVVMFRDDVMQLGDFDFQPSRPGLYRLSLHVSHFSRKTDTLITHVYFHCPDLTLALQVKNAKLLHHISYRQIAIPLVTSVFFEENSDFFSFNETDLSFRNVFLGTVASRMACRKYDGILPVIYDKDKEKAEWGEKRAQELSSRLKEATQTMANGQSNCATSFTIRPATAREWELYYKTSRISPEDFSEENRSIPLQFDLAEQRVVFAPLEVKTADKSDEVELTVELTSGEFAPACVREAKVYVTNVATGAAEVQVVPLDDLPAILSGQEKIYLNAPHMRAFLQHGKYRARFQLALACPPRPVSSEEVEFEIERQLNVLRDEIFALNPYDEIRFTFALDSLRVESLAKEFLQAVKDTLLKYPAQQPPDALVFMSGHACHLGNIKSPLYNLGLSFGRALFLRDRFIAALQKQDKDFDIEVIKSTEELCDASPLVAQFIRDPAIGDILTRCFEASDGKALRGLSPDYLKRITREKIRHFELPQDASYPRSPGVPSPSNVRQRIEEVEHLLPRNVITLIFKGEKKSVNVHVVSAGFGSTVPFYRRFEIPPQKRAEFEKMGVTAPYDLYGDDRYPAGRFMNRRVEVNIIW